MWSFGICIMPDGHAFAPALVKSKLQLCGSQVLAISFSSGENDDEEARTLAERFGAVAYLDKAIFAAQKRRFPFSIHFPSKGSASLIKCHRSSVIGDLNRTLPRFRCRFDSDRPLHNFQQVTPPGHFPYFPYFPIEPVSPFWWSTPARLVRQELRQNIASSSQPLCDPSVGG
jgi:hypothetical protein